MGAATAIVALPLAVFAVPPARAAWAAVGASIVLHVAYNLMLVAIYRAGDYNQVYPVARGTAPPVVAIAAVLVVGERLSADQVLGLLVLSGGVLVLAVGRLFCGEGVATALVLWGGGVRSGRAAGARAGRGVAQRAAAAAAVSLVAYLLVLWAQEHGRLAVVAALRETSVVFAAVIGAYLLREQLPSRRIAASVLVAAGAATLALG